MEAAATHSSAGRIRILSEAVTARIAAGEVVERPASVVKELAENALDAGARRIHVEISGGGRDLVRVSDDGCGLNSADLELCVLAHATSKISTAEDLSTLTTLGFRGEALPSIASVSKFSITSRCRLNAQDSACCIQLAGGKPERPQVKPAAGPFGTTVEVAELFYNLPARAKFLKGAAAEAGACTDILLRLALTRPDVGFTLVQDGQEIFSLTPEIALSEQLASQRSAGHATPALERAAFFRRARQVLGRDNSRGLLEVSAPEGLSTDNGYRLFGLISPPANTRPNRNAIYLNINGRPVKDRTLTSALLEAYRHLLPGKRFPLAVLFVELPPLDVDINVHPTKAEVRFRTPGLVYSLLHHAVRSACGIGPEPTAAQVPPPNLNSGEPFKLQSPPPSPPRTLELWSREVEPTAEAARSPLPVSPAEDSPLPLAPGSARVANPAPAPGYAPGAVTFPPRVAEGAPSQLRPQGAPPRPSAPLSTSPFGARRPEAPAVFRVLGQAGGAYIVLEDDGGLQIIDQHAVHERVLFEHFLKRAEGTARGDAQGLLIAETLELTPVQASVFSQDDTAKEVLTNLGFETDSFGARTLVVRAVPAILKSGSGALVRDVLDALSSDDSPGSRKPNDRGFYREKAAYTLACKGAIKAGERLTLEQMTALVLEYRRCVRTPRFTCPHGRPVAVELSWDDLERGVGRK